MRTLDDASAQSLQAAFNAIEAGESPAHAVRRLRYEATLYADPALNTMAAALAAWLVRNAPRNSKRRDAFETLRIAAGCAGR